MIEFTVSEALGLAEQLLGKAEEAMEQGDTDRAVQLAKQSQTIARAIAEAARTAKPVKLDRAVA